MLRKAGHHGRSVRLKGFNTTAARSLYARLGFRLATEQALAFELVWSPERVLAELPGD